ncbi:hypothetical protein [Anaerosacchariphilus polymeriproducens]|uniref:DUF4366 domain-containing protein n=1 Tax=Anaerosacchariphilus polymeriproducens TaxID=1812858 RepID=A0A371AV27_9FIRM|nr:hypothetical protein [Anaerosacchariphilus polymeriproducens]RDU23392.1 hypothetical protein DWV06_10075 [Anaerosacchariphilus polymeriproducens]
MLKKWWKQTAAIALAFALIFQSPAALLNVAATATNENEENTVPSNNEETNGSDTNQNPTETEKNESDNNETDTEKSNDESNQDSQESENTENTEENAPQETSSQPETTVQENPEENTTQTETNTNTTKTQETVSQPTGDKTIQIDGVNYKISDGFSQDDAPANFSITSLDYNGNTVSALKFNNGEIYLLYLVKDGNYSGSFFVYNQTDKSAYPFHKIGNDENYIFVLKTPEGENVPDGFAETTLLIEENTVSAYRYNAATTSSGNQPNADSSKTETATEETDSDDTTNTLSPADFYLIYGMSSDGYRGWFQYDAGLKNYLRYISFGEKDKEENSDSVKQLEKVQGQLDSLNKKYETVIKNRVLIISGLIIFIFVLIIIITGLIFKVRDLKYSSDWDDDDDDDDNDDIGDGKRKWNDDYDYDVDDEDDYSQEVDLTDVDYKNNKLEKKVEEGIKDESNNQSFIQDNKTSLPTMGSDFREENRISPKDIMPSMEISSEETIMAESELAKEVAKAMSGQQERPKPEFDESSEDNFNFEFVDLD